LTGAWNGIKRTISFLDEHDGCLIFLATLALTIITYFYLQETRLSRELIKEDIYRRSLPVMFCNTPINEKDKDRVVTKITVVNNGASAFAENIIVFWADDSRLIFENRTLVIIGETEVPIYRYQCNHPANSQKELTLDFSKIKPKINNFKEFYLLVILKYNVPLSKECLFEKFCYKYEPKNDLGRWQHIPMSKAEELYEKAQKIRLDPNKESKETQIFLENFFIKKIDK